ncbi:alpha/beta hydrolase [Cellulophaga sp. L1A9]|uniref:RBBP9/YdeN family alpha/beta hydrolase n=1 Tax=Cellulophaga sp. L1A9 TaxID=2686362 RepID=UPI00131D756E|nr:alpha/beta hydrolase [Cellulophaga sp. L1A9]
MEQEETKLLIIPGLGGSGADHWQSFWLQKFNASERVNQENWKEPKLKDWLTNLNEAILRLDCPTILVAHSLAVSLVLHWVNTHTNPNIKGALLVAPADVDDPMHTPEIVRGFAPMPTSKLPFPSIVVASENDDFVSLERAKYFAEQWHSDFKNIGLKGHINSDSKLEFWEEGQVILEQLIKMTK